MQKNIGLTVTKIIVILTFLAMVITNSLANIIPINGQNTGEVSDSYQNLFAPAAITFSIWGLIYLLLAIYTLYQIFFYKNEKNLKKVGIVFSISSLANTAWIFSWHYDIIILSMILMLVLLISLIMINLTLKDEVNVVVTIPFSVYFGWITVATIANATTLLVSINWNGFGISEEIWSVVVILVGMVIGTVTMLRLKDIAYGLVLVWAYIGILIKHMSASGFNNEYKSIVTTTSISIVIFIIALVYIIVKKVNKRKAAII